MADLDLSLFSPAERANVDKILALHQASQRKIQSMQEMFANRIAQAKVDEGSLVNKWGLDEDGTAGSLVNIGSSIAAGASRNLRELANLPLDSIASKENASLNDNDRAAYNRYLENKPTPEDIALLNTRREDEPHPLYGDIYKNIRKDSDHPLYKGIYNSLTQKDAPPTILERFLKLETAQETAADTSKKFDISSIVHQGNRRALSNAIRNDGFEQDWQQLKDGATALTEGQLADGAVDMVAGLGKLGSTIGKAVVEHPLGSIEFAAENAPQFLAAAYLGLPGKAAMVGSTAGYASENYRNAILKWRNDHGGQHPPEAVQNELAKDAAMLFGAEFASDLVVLKSIKAAAKGAKEAITGAVTGTSTEVAKEVARTGFLQSIKNIGVAGASGFASEGPTEGFQKVVEDRMQGKEASAIDIWENAVIGGLSGMHLISTLRAGAELTKNTPEYKEAADARLKTVIKNMSELTKIRDTGDASALADPTSANYAPATGIVGLYGNSQLETTTPEMKAANLKKANEILAGLHEQHTIAAFSLQNATEEGIQGRITKLEQLIAKTDPANKQALDSYNNLLASSVQAKEDLAKNPVSKKEVKELQKRLDGLNNELTEASKNKTALQELIKPSAQTKATVEEDIKLTQANINDLSEEDVTVAKSAADRLVTLSMASPESITPKQAKQLSNDKNTILTVAQRGHFRMLSEARQAENRLKGLKDVSEEVTHGSTKPGKQYNGISKYVSMMATAINAGDESLALSALEGIADFSLRHNDKNNMAKEAQRTAYGKPGQILFDKPTQRWVIVPTTQAAIPWKEMNALGGLTTNSNSLMNALNEEANALLKNTAALKSTYELAFNKPAPATINIALDNWKSNTAPSVGVVSTPVVNSNSVQQPAVGVDPTVNSTVTSTTPPEGNKPPDEGSLNDPLLEATRALIKANPGITAKEVKEKFNIGYNRSARLLEEIAQYPSTDPVKPVKINIWFGSGENAELSNLATRPFTMNDKRYFSVEHVYQT